MDEKFSFSWSNLSAWCTGKVDGRKMILNKVSGTVYSGSLVAVMGLSGVGKTTFLASLAGKNKDKEGSILLNNCVLEETYLQYYSSYVYQTDIIVESLTVMEHLKFMSSFKLNKSSRETSLIINDILVELHLENCKNTYLKYLSGGEKKRISLAVELLNDPLILFCDEPTTGLDSSSAITIIQKLRNRVATQRLVILTIHQPSSQLFDFFTDVILLVNGEIFYHGSKEAIASYFDSLKLYCPLNYNPAEFYIKCISSLNHCDGIKSDDTKISFENETFTEMGTSKFFTDYKYSKCDVCHDLYWLLWRTWIDTRRNFGYHLFQFCLLLITASILASFYSMVENNGGSSVQNIKGILYFFTSELIFTHTYNVVNTFPGEYAIFLREKPLYSTGVYFISKVLAIIPRNIIQPFSFLVINFLFVEFLSGFDMFFQVFGITVCACLSGSMLGLCISAIFTSLEYMDLFIAPFELVTMLAAGILININSLMYFQWIKYLSPFYYTYESLSIIHWSKINNLDCSNATTICYESGREVLEELGFHTEPAHIVWNIFYMMILSITVAVIALLAVAYRRYRHFSY